MDKPLHRSQTTIPLHHILYPSIFPKTNMTLHHHFCWIPMCVPLLVFYVYVYYIYIYYGRILNHIDRLLLDSDWTVNSGSRFHSRTVVYDSDWTMMMMMIIIMMIIIMMMLNQFPSLTFCHYITINHYVITHRTLYHHYTRHQDIV